MNQLFEVFIQFNDFFFHSDACDIFKLHYQRFVHLSMRVSQFSACVVTFCRKFNEVWTKESWEDFRETILKRSNFDSAKKKSEFFEMQWKQKWDVKQLTVDEGGRHCVCLLKKIKSQHCFVFMHNKLLSLNFRRTNSCCFCHQITDHLHLQQWCNIFQTIIVK